MSVWELFRRYPCWCLFIVAAAFLWGAVANANSSERVKELEYREIEGEICNLKTVHRRHATRYNYDIVWYVDGVKYIKHMKEEIDRQPEGKRSIWISKDNQSCVLYSPEDIALESKKELLIGMVAGIAGVITLVVRRGRRRKENRRNYGKT